MTSGFYNSTSSTKNDSYIKLPNKPKEGFPGKPSVLYSRRGDTEDTEIKKQKGELNNEQQIISNNNKWSSNLISARDGHSSHLFKT